MVQRRCDLTPETDPHDTNGVSGLHWGKLDPVK